MLLVENLDRVSRETPRKALELFLRVINLGIGIVTLTDEDDHFGARRTGFRAFGFISLAIA